MNAFHRFRISKYIWLAFALLTVTAVYWPGLSGYWLFDDYPNIVDNHGVQPSDASIPSLVRAILSSPASEFKRPLASLSFASNYLFSGLDPYWMKLTNLVIHLLNGIAIFALTRMLLLADERTRNGANEKQADLVAALVAAGWMLLPINLTAVLYVVQRMESMANLCVLLGLIGYVAGRQRMLMLSSFSLADSSFKNPTAPDISGFILCAASLILCTAIGALAKETAVMLPMYALLIEWTLFRFHALRSGAQSTYPQKHSHTHDRRIVVLFLLVLVVPMLFGLAWLLPGLLKPEAWATRNFTLGTRLLSEARIVVDYIVWTVWPTPAALSFYHDDFIISTGLLTPWTTLASLTALAALVGFIALIRLHYPLAALGIALFLGCHLLTATVLPLELIYEHRNYFASFGLLLAIVPILAAPPRISTKVTSAAASHGLAKNIFAIKAAATESRSKKNSDDTLPFSLPRYVLLAGLMLWWTSFTAMTAYAWGDQLRLAQELAVRAPASPRAQYELGRTYIIYSQYNPASPFTQLAYSPLEQAASLPGSSILPQQALIFMNSHMHLPLQDAWWDSMVAKLKERPADVQDESSLAVLVQCARDTTCDLPKSRMHAAFNAALAHPHPSARLMAIYSDYAWNVLGDRLLGKQMILGAIQAAPNEPAYRITLIRMLIALNQHTQARSALDELKTLDIGGRLDTDIAQLQQAIGAS